MRLLHTLPYLLLQGFLYLLSWLPLCILYRLSDGCYLLVYYIVGYRKKLVRKHLAQCFPEKDEQEQRRIERGFYHWFCDYVVETIKLLTMSKKEIMRRMTFKNISLLDEATAKGLSCGVYLGHYCNWEWVTSLQLWVNPQGQCAQIYHILENAWAEKLFLSIRSRFGSDSIPMAETLRRIALYRKKQQPIILGYISDQVPYWNNIHHWLDFLHHDTPVLTGTEKVITATKQVPFYMDIQRIRRGYYEATLLPLQTPASTKATDKAAEGAWPLTDQYFQLLEATIRRQPAYYLWTHNRWKRTHEEFNLRYDPETGRVNLTDSIEVLRRRANEGCLHKESTECDGQGN